MNGGIKNLLGTKRPGYPIASMSIVFGWWPQYDFLRASQIKRGPWRAVCKGPLNPGLPPPSLGSTSSLSLCTVWSAANFWHPCTNSSSSPLNMGIKKDRHGLGIAARQQRSASAHFLPLPPSRYCQKRNKRRYVCFISQRSQ